MSEPCVHVLLNGATLCRYLSHLAPPEWPPEHTWVSLERADAATCEACKIAANRIRERSR